MHTKKDPMELLIKYLVAVVEEMNDQYSVECGSRPRRLSMKCMYSNPFLFTFVNQLLCYYENSA